MIDSDTAGVPQFVALAGLGVSLVLCAFAERSSAARKTLLLASAAAALASTLICYLGVMAAADSGTSRILPRFP